jgi:hypothetical protein
LINEAVANGKRLLWDESKIETIFSEKMATKNSRGEYSPRLFCFVQNVRAIIHYSFIVPIAYLGEAKIDAVDIYFHLF